MTMTGAKQQSDLHITLFITKTVNADALNARYCCRGHCQVL